MNASNISYFENYANQKPVLDLRMLLIINVITSSLLLVSHQIEITIGAFLISFVALLIFKMFKQVFWYTLVFLGSIFFVIVLPHLQSTHIIITVSKILGLFVFFAGKMIPFIMIAHVIFTKISVNYLVASLRKLQLHRGLLLSLVVALRYLPTAKAEFEYIKNAMRLRGIEITIKNFLKSPLKIIEYSLVPLLFRNVKVAEEMSAAATVKGIEFDGKQSSVFVIKMGVSDYCFMIFATLLFGASFFHVWSLDLVITFIENIL